MTRKSAGHEIILVSSGAIAMGFRQAEPPERPHDMPTKQASAAVGQCELMYVYDKLFTEYNHTVAQLPDHRAGHCRRRQQEAENFHNTLDRLLELGPCPSSTRMTRFPRRRSPWAIMIPFPLWWPPQRERSC
ncbi:MAG: hypothetical protein ACLU38_06730 [Dysosmobacter sp.]